MHDSLHAFVVALGDRAPRLSRLRISTAPGRCTVEASVAEWEHQPALAILDPSDPGKDEPYRPRPRALDDAEGRLRNSPPAVMHLESRTPAVAGTIPTADLDGQVAELERSGIVGRLNVETTASGAIAITTHAGDQEERNAWVRSLGK